MRPKDRVQRDSYSSNIYIYIDIYIYKINVFIKKISDVIQILVLKSFAASGVYFKCLYMDVHEFELVFGAQ